MLSFHMTGFIELVPLTIVGVDLIALMVALAVLLMACAGWVILWVLHVTLGSISIGPFHPFDFFYNTATNALKSLWGQFAKRVPAFGHFLWSLVMMVWRPLYVIGATMTGLLTQLVGVSQASQQGLARLQAREDFFIIQLRDAEQAAIANLGLNVLSIEAQLQAEIDNQIAKERGDIFNVSNALFQQVGVLNDTITGDINGLRTQLINTLQSDVLNLNNRITNNVNTINATISRDVNSLTQADATNLRTAENFATGLVSGLGVGQLRQTLTTLQGQVSKIATETTECLDPLCDTVTPNASKLGNLGKYLKLLENLGIEALILALAVEAVNDPRAVANDMEAVLLPLGQVVDTVFRDTVGV